MSDGTLSLCAIVSASFYMPLTFWATNAWQVGDPLIVLGFGVGLSLVGVALFLLFRRHRKDTLALGFGIAIIILAVMSWNTLPVRNPVVVVVTIVAIVLLVGRLDHRLKRWVAIGFTVLFGVAPAGQLVMEHITNATELPTQPLEARTDAQPSGAVEDVLVVVVDSYPSLIWSRVRYGHKPTELVIEMDAAGFETPDVAWSQHATTALSVSALMELNPVVDTQAEVDWGNTRNLRRIIGGDNLVASTLRSAGFHYTHIESGWHHGSCVEVDTCVSSSLLNETTWQLLQQSVIGKSLRDSFGSWLVPVSKTTHESLLALEDVFDDGQLDYIYAHVMLPHEPYVVNENCEVYEGPTHEDIGLSSQLACADRLLEGFADLAGPDTAVLISGDHGQKTRGQLDESPGSWSELDIVDAFSVLLSYRIPAACPNPVANVNTLVLAAILECATDMTAPANDGSPLIGRNPHRWVTTAELKTIENGLLSGELLSNPSG